MKLILQGIIGSIPGGKSDLGHNTTSLKIEDGDKQILIDSGSGILGHFSNVKHKEHHILFTHYHLDHVIGLPFIKQIYDKKHTFNLYGPNLNKHTTSTLLPNLLRQPFLPIDLGSIHSKMNHHILEPSKTYQINGFEVHTMLVKHPGGSMVYRIHSENKKIAVLTDLANEIIQKDQLIDFIKNSDLIYIDATFTKEEIKDQKDYGHCTIEHAIELFNASSSKKLIIGHHPQSRKLSDVAHYQTNDILIGIEGKTYSV